VHLNFASDHLLSGVIADYKKTLPGVNRTRVGFRGKQQKGKSQVLGVRSQEKQNHNPAVHARRASTFGTAANLDSKHPATQGRLFPKS